MVDMETGDNLSALDLVALSYQKRFETVITPSSMSVAGHSVLAGGISIRYAFRFPGRLNGCEPYKFVVMCFTHDFQELVMGDTPRSVKRALGKEEVNHIEDHMYDTIIRWLHDDISDRVKLGEKRQSPFFPELELVQGAVAEVDQLALIAEIGYYLMLWPEHQGIHEVLRQQIKLIIEADLVSFMLYDLGINTNPIKDKIRLVQEEVGSGS